MLKVGAPPTLQVFGAHPSLIKVLPIDVLASGHTHPHASILMNFRLARTGNGSDKFYLNLIIAWMPLEHKKFYLILVSGRESTIVALSHRRSVVTMCMRLPRSSSADLTHPSHPILSLTYTSYCSFCLYCNSARSLSIASPLYDDCILPRQPAVTTRVRLDCQARQIMPQVDVLAAVHGRVGHVVFCVCLARARFLR